MRIALATVIVLALGGAALAQDAASKTRGLALATSVCSACHLVTAKDPLVTTGAPSFTSVAQSEGASEAAIGVFLRTSHQTMPNFVLSADEIRDLAAYIMSLKPPR